MIRRWIWTLGNLNGFIILSCLGLLFTFAQSRAWVILRHFVFLLKKTIRLDTSEPEPLEHLSQANAVLDIWPYIRYRLSNLRLLSRWVEPAQPDSSVISPHFGIVALFNIGMFITLSLAIPCLISEGMLGEAIVKSRTTEKCSLVLRDQFNTFESSHGDGLPEGDAILKPCQGRLNQGCDKQYYLQQPHIEKTRPKGCMFPEDIYHNSTNTFQITQSNITAYELGLNSKSGMTMNHRLTCSPVYLDSFLVPN